MWRLVIRAGCALAWCVGRRPSESMATTRRRPKLVGYTFVTNIVGESSRPTTSGDVRVTGSPRPAARLAAVRR